LKESKSNIKETGSIENMSLIEGMPGNIARFSDSIRDGEEYDYIEIIGSFERVPHSHDIDELVPRLKSAIEHLTKDGQLVLILPGSYLTAISHHEFRESMLDNLSIIMCLKRVILGIHESFPIGVIGFQRERSEKIYMYDGIMESKDQVQKLIRKENVEDSFFVENVTQERWDVNYFSPKYKELDEKISLTDSMLLKELVSINAGIQTANYGHLLKPIDEFNLKKGLISFYDVKIGTTLPLIEGRSLSDDRLLIEKIRYVIRVDEHIIDKIPHPNDILVRQIGTKENLIRTYVVKDGDPAFVPSNIIVLTPKNPMYSYYIADFFNSEVGRVLFKKQLDRISGNGLHVLIHNLENIKIPIIKIPGFNIDAISKHGFLNSTRQVEILAKMNYLIQKQESMDSTLTEFSKQTVQALTEMDRKLDTLLKEIKDLGERISSIKAENRSVEEKLVLIQISLEKEISSLKATNAELIADYSILIQSQIIDWFKLEEYTKETISISEYLYSQLQKINSEDYSMIVLGFCRSFENELWRKIFISFTHFMYERYPDFETRFARDLGKLAQTRKEKEENKVKKFAQAILKFIENPSTEPKFTLGDMEFTLSLLTGETIKNSDLLQEFSKFLLERFNIQLQEKPFLAKLKHVNEDFRVKSAHPYKLLISDALNCKQEIISILEEFLEYIKNYKQ